MQEHRGIKPMEQSNGQPGEKSELKKLADDMDKANVVIIGDEEDPAFLMRPEVRKGRLIGDERVRWEVSRKSSFKRVGMGLQRTGLKAPVFQAGDEKPYLLGRDGC